MSSFNPRKKITTAAATKYCNSGEVPFSVPTRKAMIKPAKIPKPPSVGITVL